LSLPATEVFSGTDGTTPPNANWTNMATGVKILTNACAAVTAAVYAAAFWNADAFDNDQFAQATILGAFNNTGPIVRAVSSGGDNYYMLDANDSGATNTYLFKCIGGGFTLIQTFGVTFAGGDIAKISIAGTTIQCFKNAGQIGTDSTDSALASGSAGVMANTITAGLDNWEGGNVGAASTTPRVPRAFRLVKRRRSLPQRRAA